MSKTEITVNIKKKITEPVTCEICDENEAKYMAIDGVFDRKVCEGCAKECSRIKELGINEKNVLVGEQEKNFTLTTKKELGLMDYFLKNLKNEQRV